VWMAIRFLSRARLFRHVDDTLGVIYTHGIAGLCGGLLVGLFADPAIVEYIPHGGGATALPGVSSVFYGGSWTLLRWQAEAGLWVIVFTAIMTYVILMFIKHVLRIPLRLTDEELEIGDHAIHGNEVYPSDVPTLGGSHPPAWQPSGSALGGAAG
jgi:Amt family ammonium transporter